ncbi:MAG TPA: rhodanese-like domain-containing protein [Mucilaginibacter sp.]|jgi:hypothetical protein|nr:rhodanese-like domain-containing protein [Mucilaginibacter sp.]
MKKIFMVICCCLFGLLLFAQSLKAQSPPVSSTIPAADPWKAAELMDPATLAAQLKTGAPPIIFNIGAVEDIKTAKHVGPVSDAKNLAKFKSMIASLPKDSKIIIYCGCCALPKCPNVRPAYRELKAAGFTNIQVLNLLVNLKTNWIAMGYPLADK